LIKINELWRNFFYFLDLVVKIMIKTSNVLLI